MNQETIELIDTLINSFQTTGTYPPLNPIQNQLLSPQPVRDALVARGFPDPFLTNPSHPNYTPVGKLTQTQKAVIELVCNYHDPRPLSRKLQLFQMTVPQYNQWLKNPYFASALKKEVSRKFNADLQIDSNLALGHLIANEKDLSAIKYFHEMTGVYRPQTETQVNLTVILGKLMEVLVRFVSPDKLPELANEIEVKVLGIEERVPPVEQNN